MTTDAGIGAVDWRSELPTLASRLVTLRELAVNDLVPLAELLSAADATRFGDDEPNAGIAAHRLIERAVRDRTNGRAFTYAITLGATRAFIGARAGAAARSGVRDG